MSNGVAEINYVFGFCIYLKLIIALRGLSVIRCSVDDIDLTGRRQSYRLAYQMNR